MTDPRTAAYLRELRMNLHRQMSDAVKTAGELCDCPNCVSARASKTLSACEQGRIMRKIHDRVILPNRSNFLPELSPNYFDNKFKVTSRKAF
jgi:hypothetical protein